MAALKILTVNHSVLGERFAGTAAESLPDTSIAPASRSSHTYTNSCYSRSCSASVWPSGLRDTASLLSRSRFRDARVNARPHCLLAVEARALTFTNMPLAAPSGARAETFVRPRAGQ